MTKNVTSLIWIMLEKFGGTFISSISFFVYAAILTPIELGVATIALVISMGIAQVLSTFFQDPIVCQKKLSVIFLSTMFWGALVITILVYMVLIVFVFLLSDDTGFLLLIIISGAMIPILSICAIYVAILRRKGKFKFLAKRMLLGKFLGAALGISTAFYGFGSTSLIIQAVTIELFALILLVLSQKVRIHAIFEFKYLKETFSLGGPIAIRKLSFEGFVKGIPLCLAAFLGPAAVGIYAFAWRVVDMPKSALVSGANSFVLPVFMKHTHDVNSLKDKYLQVNYISFLFFCPIFVGLIILAEPLLGYFFDNKWNDAILPIQGLALVSLLSFMRMYIPVLFTSLLIPSTTLKTEVTSTILGLAVCIILLPYFGVMAPVIALLVKLIINLPVTLLEVSNKINLAIREQFFMFNKVLLASLTMFIITQFTSNALVELPVVLSMLITVFIGAFTYALTILAIDHKARVLFKKKFN
jgi:O-antigen/teichoic acid export membrane protein